MELLTTKQFNGVQLDCYKAECEDDGFWTTREQIGRLLEYSEPMKSIAKIHERNADRLNKFSTVVKLTQVEGTRMVTRDVIVYNFKGFLEICRFSNQPKANAVMDFAWSVMDEIRKHGSYSAMTPAEFLLEQAKLLVEQERRITAVEKKVNVLEARMQTRPEEYFSIAGYASLRDINVDVNRANRLGRRAAKLSRENGYEIFKTPDERYGTVNTYHVDILKEVFQERTAR